MDLQLGECVTVVVGGARGLGQAIAAAFVAEGARAALLDVSSDVHALAEQFARSGAGARGWMVDVTDFAAVEAAAREVASEFGTPHHVVFAAAIGSGKFGFPFWKLDPQDWDAVLKVNLIGAVHVAHAFAPAMAEAGRLGTDQDISSSRSLLFLSSVAGQIGSQTDPPYSAAKAAVINFAQCAAKDLAPYGVRVNALCPGMVQTPLNRSVYEAWAREQPETGRPSYEEWSAEKIRRLVPLNRWQQPEDIAAMAVFLASSQGRNITGQTINVDGGYVMHW